MKILQYEVYFVSLDPVVGAEIQKTRPCLIISPDRLNELLKTVVVAPLTSQPKGFYSRVPVSINGKQGEIVMEQIRTIDKSRIVNKVGMID